MGPEIVESVMSMIYISRAGRCFTLLTTEAVKLLAPLALDR